MPSYVSPAAAARQITKALRVPPLDERAGWISTSRLSEIVSKIDGKKLALALAVTFAISAGGFLIWYRASRRMVGQQILKNIPELDVGKIDHVSRTQDGRKRLTTSESNKTVPEGVLILHQCPRGRRTPSIAPYPLKLETFLRIHGIKYQVEFNNNEPRVKDSPWITLDLEDICDSQQCISFLVERYGLKLHEDLTEEEKSTMRAYSHLLENHLYWGIGLWRWVYDGARSLGEIQNLPLKTMRMIPQVCKTVEQSAYFHGIGKRSPTDVTASILRDLEALSHFLGPRMYFIKDTPSELDCTAFAMLAQMLWNMDASPYEKALKDKHTNLVEFCWRMRTMFWPDWDDCLDQSKNDEMVESPNSLGTVTEKEWA